MRSARGWWGDGWLWLLALSVFVVFLLDEANPDVRLVGFLTVPVMASAFLGQPWKTASLAALSAALGAFDLLVRGVGVEAERAVLFVVADAFAIGLAEVVRRDRDRLAKAHEEFRVLAETAIDAVMRISMAGVVEFATPAIRDLLGWEPGDVVGKQAAPLVHPGDLPAVEAARASIRSRPTGSMLLRMLRAAGDYVWVGGTYKAFVDEHGQVAGIVAYLRDAQESVALESQLRQRATHDDLTGALGRGEALSRLAEIGRHVRRAGEDTAVLFVDLDDFKAVNDEHGHVAGDTVLRTMVDRIQGTIRATDLVARMGGDEFLVILDGLHELAEAREIAEKVRVAAERPIAVPGGQVCITVSVGVTLYRPDEGADDVMARADRAMYAAKRSGRNRVVAVTE